MEANLERFGLCMDELCKVHGRGSGIRLTPREPGVSQPHPLLASQPLRCKPGVIAMSHRAGRLTFYDVCKVLAQCLEPNKCPVFVSSRWFWVKDGKP